MSSPFDRFVESAESAPDRPVLIEGDRMVTSAAMERATALLSEDLLGQVRAGQLVASLVHRGVDAALLAIAANRSGVPITFFDRSQPASQVTQVLETAACALLVTAPEDRALADHLSRGRIPIWEVRPNDYAGLRDRAPQSPPQVDETVPAIVVFSSGTTGDPKGVIRSVSGLVVAGENCVGRYGLASADIVGDLASFRFVTSFGTLYGALFSESAVSFHDIDGDGILGVAEWALRTRVTVLRMQAALMRTLVELGTDLRASRVRSFSIAGETLFGPELERLRSLLPPGCEIQCVYGSSEGGGIARVCFAAGDPIPDGRVRFPRPTVARIVDSSLTPLPDGEVGEIVTSMQRSLGYWKRPSLTDERYVLGADGVVWYRTGDLGRFADGNTLEVLGRSDSQVKVRGFNVELTEIEAALLQHPDVRSAAVVDVPRAGGGTALIGYFTPTRGALPATAALRRHLGERLPSYKIPSRFVVLDSLPKTPAGKIDRNILRNVTGFDNDRELRPPRNAIERALIDYLCRLLGAEALGIDDDFFEVGGDSLSAIEFTAWASDRFGLTLHTAVLLSYPTVRLLAQHLEQNDNRRTTTTIGVLRDHADPAVTLVLVAGGGDSIVSQRPLAKAIRSDVRIIGVQGRGIDDRKRTETGIASYAKRAVRELLAQDPKGPFIVCGHSFGGVVAQEVARQLELLAKPVRAVVVIDTVAPSKHPAPGVLRSVKRRIGGWREELADRRSMFRVRQNHRESLRLRKGIVFATHVRALRSHQTLPCHAPILVIRASDNTTVPEQAFARWGELTLSGVSISPTRGSHVSIKDHPFVGGVAALIDALIDDQHEHGVVPSFAVVSDGPTLHRAGNEATV